MMRPITNINIHVNVDRSDAEELYDEIECYISLCIDECLSSATKINTFDKTVSDSSIDIEKLFSKTALTGYLRARLNSIEIEVIDVKFEDHYQTFSRSIYLTLYAHNLWAMKYGKSSGTDIGEALEFFTNRKDDIAPVVNTPVVQDSPNPIPAYPVFNGKLVKPIIGSLYFDQLANKMFLWDGMSWCNAND